MNIIRFKVSQYQTGKLKKIHNGGLTILNNQIKQTMNDYFPDFSHEDYKLIINALEKRQRNYIAGDKMYNKYASLAGEMRRRSESAVLRRV